MDYNGLHPTLNKEASMKLILATILAGSFLVSLPVKADDKPVLPVKSVDETSVGWGEAPEPDDEERLRQDRPPHWDQ